MLHISHFILIVPNTDLILFILTSNLFCTFDLINDGCITLYVLFSVFKTDSLDPFAAHDIEQYSWYPIVLFLYLTRLSQNLHFVLQLNYI